MHTHSLLWQPQRQRAIRIDNRATAKQHLRQLRNLSEDLRLVSGERGRRVFRVRR